jgi:hypothetical protein
LGRTFGVLLIVVVVDQYYPSLIAIVLVQQSLQQKDKSRLCRPKKKKVKGDEPSPLKQHKPKLSLSLSLSLFLSHFSVIITVVRKKVLCAGFVCCCRSIFYDLRSRYRLLRIIINFYEILRSIILHFEVQCCDCLFTKYVFVLPSFQLAT